MLIGSPTLDLYVASWNTKYPSNRIYTATNSYGYYVGTSENPTSTQISMENTPGYSDSLYYPHTSYWNSYGYWLASYSAYSNGDVYCLSFSGGMSSSNYGTTVYTFRPVICLPSSLFE